MLINTIVHFSLYTNKRKVRQAIPYFDKYRLFLLLSLLTVLSRYAVAQQVLGPGSGFGNRMGQNQNKFDQDSAFNKPKNTWKNIPPVIYFKTLHSDIRNPIDSSIKSLIFQQSRTPYERHLGNYGLASRDWQVRPYNHVIGPQVAYSAFDRYAYSLEELPYYNTTRPFSDFGYSLGSKQEQTVSILHTQNITRHWNAAFKVRNINSPGYYRGQYATYNGSFFTTNYRSKNYRYGLNAGILYNKNNNKENGGIINDSLLTDTRFVDKIQIPIRFDNSFSGLSSSNLYNSHQSIQAILSHHYSWGVADTVYNDDSTTMTPRFTPRFRLKHEMQFTAAHHVFFDKVAESTIYAEIKPEGFIINRDTLRQNLRWTQLDNRFTLSGFVGKAERLIQLEAGAGNSVDVIDDRVKDNGSRVILVNNYLYANLLKEALKSNQWEFGAKVKFIFAGSSVGDLKVEGAMAKNLAGIGGFRLSGMQIVQTPAYNFGNYTTSQFIRNKQLNKMSTTRVGASLTIPRVGIVVNANSLLLGNYVYWDDKGHTQQYGSVFNMIQISASHNVKIKYVSIDNEALIQKNVGFAPANFPLVMIQHTTTYDRKIFKNRLHLNAGVNIRYYTPFDGVGYNPFVNQFTYLTGTNTNNAPEIMLFAAFKVKTLRLYASLDQGQQLLIKKNVTHYSGYPMPDALFRFGFQWFLYN